MNKRDIWIYAIAALFLFSSPLYADQCNDVFAKADDLFESAVKAIDNKNYDQAVELFNEASEYYEQVANMKNCSCPTISKNARENVVTSKRNARKFKEYKMQIKGK
jgi:hypothetical protein